MTCEMETKSEVSRKTLIITIKLMSLIVQWSRSAKFIVFNIIHLRKKYLLMFSHIDYRISLI